MTPCTKHTSSFARLILTGVFMLLGFLTAHATPVKFDIPAQPAPAALDLFGKQGKVSVAYSLDDLKGVTAHAVTGIYEPAAALDLLLQDTGFTAKPKGRDGFVITKAKAVAATGSVRGSLTGEGGKGLANVLVSIRETSQSAETDRYGQYAFPNVAAGTYVLVASASGYQTMHITDVRVNAGRELVLGKEEMRKATEGPLALEPFEVHADTVEQLEKFEVTGTKQQPFSDRNVDLPRGINDVQPYYVFDAKTIDQSGATNVGDFLKQRLTMNATAATPDQFQQGGNLTGPTNTGSINLRGLGVSETLILVDGRRLPNVAFSGSDPTQGKLLPAAQQPDINGIPLSAIDHIEILPSSASAIYGGNAIGGVVNIVLKKGYVGGEVKATYDVTSDGHAPLRTVTASFGAALEGGKTHIFVTTQYSDSKPLYTGDRAQLINRGYAALLQNDPAYISSNYTKSGLFGFPPGFSFNPFLGATTNVASFSHFSGPNGTQFNNLTLKSNGASLNSLVATFPQGYVAGTSDPASIIGGSWNLNLPNTNQSPNGLLSPLGSFPKNKSVIANVRRQMTDKVEMFADFSYAENSAYSTYNPISFLPFRILGTNAFNPFNQDVQITIPINLAYPSTSNSITQTATLGAIIKLPFEWSGELDYTWSRNRFSQSTQGFVIGDGADVLAVGIINPFQDNVAHPPAASALAPYLYTQSYRGANSLSDLAFRGAGPIAHLPWGNPTLALSLEHRKESQPNQYLTAGLPIGSPQEIADKNFNLNTTYLSQSQADDSVYGELDIPLVRKEKIPLLSQLELQVAGRVDRYTVSAGTQYVTVRPYNTPPSTTYGGPTLNGQPFSSDTRYNSANSTVGLKYNPVKSLTVRVSKASAFLPPTYSQLLPNPLPDVNPTLITDPKNLAAGRYGVQTISGGNPNLKPQTSESWDVGVIWEPQVEALKGFRANLEYYKIDQHNTISALNAQTIVTDEALYPGRVTRDPSTGLITRVDQTLLNLFANQTNGWDMTVDYRKGTSVGTFEISLTGTVIEHEKRQTNVGSPSLEYVGWTNSGGEAKTKANGTLTWANGHWAVAWSARYYGSYNQLGAPGGPTNDFANTPLAQGSNTIPSQTYHDLFVSYSFGASSKRTEAKFTAHVERLFANTTLQLGIKNVFDKLPPFDAYSAYAPFYYSPYGDIRLRDLWFSVRKQF